MTQDNLLEEIQEDYRKANEVKNKKPRKPRAKKVKKPSFVDSVKVYLACTLVTLIVLVICGELYANWRLSHKWQSPIVFRSPVVTLVEVLEVSEVLLPIEELESAEEALESGESAVWIGGVSYYSHGVGCVGCSDGEIMANGEKFNENAMTLAFNDLPLNTRVRVTNMDNGANIIATVTDTGGFEKYGRIADLSKGLMQELNALTDVSSIKIEAL